MKSVFVGIDIGAVSVKSYICDGDGRVLDRQYVFHEYKVMETVRRMIRGWAAEYGKTMPRLAITGQGGEEIAKCLQIPYINEIDAELAYLQHCSINVDNVVEIGGESAKITYFKPAVTQHVNRACAGGTGAFLEHMAKLLGTNVEGLDRLAGRGKKVYPIASRCGVFAKTDAQGLLNEGVEKADLAISLFHALANQVISGLSHGRPLRGKIIFLGGPLCFLPALRDCLQKELGLKDGEAFCPDDGVFYQAIGASCLSGKSKGVLWKTLENRIFREQTRALSDIEIVEGLFSSEEEYKSFSERHGKAKAKKELLEKSSGPVWLGIDAGSTTLKAVLISKSGAILKEWYENHKGDVLSRTGRLLLDAYGCLPGNCYLAGSGVTGYGEGLLKKAFHVDTGEVETMAHLRAARFFCPDVTAVLDIGGQDMKYCQLKNGKIDRISLNGVCASGCGSFLETFAESMHVDIREFAAMAALAKQMPDLGRHCTVIMNSHVKKLQGNGLQPDELAAALCVAVVKNALFSVIRLGSCEELGNYVVAEGGTFYNDAVLRALEKLIGKEVIRPDISGLMGAYGMALKAKDLFGASHTSTLLKPEEILKFRMEGETRPCPGCGNHCQVNIKRFSNGEVFITGNRCETGEMLFSREKQDHIHRLPNLYRWVKNNVFRKRNLRGSCRGVVGIPAVLDMWSDFPFWAGFWNALEYDIMISEWNDKDAKEASMTIPRRVHCYPCILAHGHLQNLLRRKPDFIWMPAHKREWDNIYTDEKRHALYGHILARFMKRQILDSSIPFLHPTLPEWGDKRLEKRLCQYMPDIPPKKIKEAIEAGYSELAAYENKYRAEMKKALSWMEKNKRYGWVFAGKSCQIDAQLHKGVPYMSLSLGMPVLSGEGFSLLAGGGPVGGGRNTERIFHDSYEAVRKNERLELVILRSVGCGMDRHVMEEIEPGLRNGKRFFTVLSLDQGTNTGAIKIRLRTLLSEMKERDKGISRLNNK